MLTLAKTKLLYWIRVTYLILWSKPRCPAHRDREGYWSIIEGDHGRRRACSPCLTVSGQDLDGHVARNEKHTAERWEVEGVFGAILRNFPFVNSSVLSRGIYYYWQHWVWRHVRVAEAAKALEEQQAEDAERRLDRLADTVRIRKEHKKRPWRVNRARLLRRG